MTTVSQMLVRGLEISYQGPEPETVPPGTFCIVCGGIVEAGYNAGQIISDATTEFLDQFRGNPSGIICHWCATCYKNSAPRAGMPTSRTCMVFEDGSYYWPLIGRGSAAANDDRPCWSDLVREVWPMRAGEQALIVLTTDQRRRLWPRARVGPLGITTPVYLFDADAHLDGVCLINWPQMVTTLDLVETIYAAGFAKRAIGGNLYEATKAMQEVSIEQTMIWERELKHMRESYEFKMALLIAQKGEG